MITAKTFEDIITGNLRQQLSAIRKILIMCEMCEEKYPEYGTPAVLTGGWLRDFYAKINGVNNIDYSKSFNDFDICVFNEDTLLFLEEKLLGFGFVLISRMNSILAHYEWENPHIYKIQLKLDNIKFDIFQANRWNVLQTLKEFDFRENSLFYDSYGKLNETISGALESIKRGELTINNKHRKNFEERYLSFQQRGWKISEKNISKKMKKK